MYKRLLSIFLLGIGFACSLWAGDAAVFVDLGFSADGRYYSFGQYGVESGSLKPWAELFIVDVPRNNFVSGGRLAYVHSAPIIHGQDGTGALYTLLVDNGPLFKKYAIDFLRQSRPLYLALNADSGSKESGTSPAESPVAGTTTEFRDFESGDTFTASLVSLVEGAGDNLKSSFFINLERTTADGSKKNYVVGTPSVKRPLITGYRIIRVMIAPRDGSMIFVIEMTKKAASGTDIRYMVEALRL